MLSRPAFTTVVINLRSGHQRMHRFHGIHQGFELDIKLDALMDEMDDGNILSPVQVIREHKDGSTRTEEIRIYSPDE